ncbi:uncharacterized protein trim33l [Fundulus diaphanus]
MESAGGPGLVQTQQCSTCDGAAARCWCVDCSEALCDDCLAAHRRVTLTRSHRVLNHQPDGSSLISPIKFCRTHPSEELKLFCFTCCLLTCRDCQLADHQNHRFDFVSKAVEKVKKQLDACMQPIKAQMEASRRSLQDMEMRLQVLAQYESFMTNKLQNHVNTLTALLRKRFEKINMEIQKVYSVERNLIHRKVEKVKLLQKNHVPLTEAAEKARNTTNLPTLVGCISQITAQLKELSDGDLCPPSNMIDVKVITDRTSVESILNLGRIHVSCVPFSVPRVETPPSSSSSPTVAPPTCSQTSSTRLPGIISAPSSTSPTLCSTDSSITSSNPSASSQRTAPPAAPVFLVASRNDFLPPPYPSSTVSSTSSSSKVSSEEPSGDVLRFVKSVLQSRSAASSSHFCPPPSSAPKSCSTKFPHPDPGSASWALPSSSAAAPPPASSCPAPPSTTVTSRTTSAVKVRNPFLTSLLLSTSPPSSDQAGPSSVGPAHPLHQISPVSCPPVVHQNLSNPSGHPVFSSSSQVSTPSSFYAPCSEVPPQTVKGSGRLEDKPSRPGAINPARRRGGSEERSKSSDPANRVRINVLTKSQLESSSTKLFVKFHWKNKKVSKPSRLSSSSTAVSPVLTGFIPHKQNPAPVQNQPGVLTNPQTAVQPSSSVSSLPSLSCSAASASLVFPQAVLSTAQLGCVQPSGAVLPLVPAPLLPSTALDPVQPLLTLNQQLLPGQKSSSLVLLTNSSSLPVLESGAGLLSDPTQLPGTGQDSCGGSMVASVSAGPGPAAPEVQICSGSSNQRLSDQRPSSGIGLSIFPLLSTLNQQPQNPDVREVVGSDHKVQHRENPENRRVAGSPAGEPSSSIEHRSEPAWSKPEEVRCLLSFPPGPSDQELVVSEEPAGAPWPETCEAEATSSKPADVRAAGVSPSPPASDDLAIVLSEDQESLPEVYEVTPGFKETRPYGEPLSPEVSDDDVSAVESEPPEDKMSAALFHEPELGLKLSSSEASDREDGGPASAKTDPQVHSQLHWQPTVSLLRLPLSLPGPGRPPPRYHFILGSKDDELYLQEVEEDAQSSDEDVSEAATDDASDVTEDFTELQRPESPLSVEIISCAACGSSSASKICTACGRGYHRDCHVPPFGADIWSELVCSLCQDLSDPSDPYSSDRPKSPRCCPLSLQDQRRCEVLLLHMKVQACRRFSQLDFWSELMLISERLSHRLSPPYDTPAQVVSDLWRLFRDASQGSPLMDLQQSFQEKLMETLGSELPPSLLMPPNTNTLIDPGGPSSPASTRMSEETEEDFMSKSKLTVLRKRLRDFLDLKGTSAAKRSKNVEHEDI